MTVSDGTSSSNETRQKLGDTWTNKIEYLLALIGYTVGVGSIWRFPIVCARNGGGAFILPFVLLTMIIGGPLYYLEICLGQFTGRGPCKAFEFCPLLKGKSVHGSENKRLAENLSLSAHVMLFVDRMSAMTHLIAPSICHLLRREDCDKWKTEDDSKSNDDCSLLLPEYGEL